MLKSKHTTLVKFIKHLRGKKVKNEGRPQSKFPIRCTASKQFIAWSDCVYVIECTSVTSQVLTVASLQRLKLGDLIPAPADCEVRCVIKVLNAQSLAPIEIHLHLCQQSFPADFPFLVAQNCHGSTCCSENCVPGGCRGNWHQNTKQSYDWRLIFELNLFIIRGAACCSSNYFLWCMESTLADVVHLFYTSRNSCLVSINNFRMTERRRWVSLSTVVLISGSRLIQHRYTKLDPTIWQKSLFWRWILKKIAKHLLYLFH